MELELENLAYCILTAADSARSSAFYGGLLGLTVLGEGNAAAPFLLYTDEPQSSDCYVIIAIDPAAPRGRPGVGALHHVAFLVESTNAQLKWKRWLSDHGVNVMGPYDRGYFRSIYFRDPDRNLLEIATRWPGLTDDEDEDELGTHDIMPPADLTPAGRDESAIRQQGWPEEVRRIGGDMDLRGLHHVTAIAADAAGGAEWYSRALGLRVVKRTRNYDDPGVAHIYLGAADGHPGSLLTLFGPGGMAPAQVGRGVPPTFGFAVSDTLQLDAWRSRLAALGSAEISGPDYGVFDALYFQDPDGMLVSLAVKK